MANEPLTIHRDPESELSRILAAAEETPVVLDSNGVRFRVTRADEDQWADYDPEAVLEGLREIAGTLSADEGERMKALIDRGREEGSRPITRP